jgi:hypothetical protein
MALQLSPEQELVVGQAIHAGLIRIPDDVVEIGIETIRQRLAKPLEPAHETLSAEEWIRELRTSFCGFRGRRPHTRLNVRNLQQNRNVLAHLGDHVCRSFGMKFRSAPLPTRPCSSIDRQARPLPHALLPTVIGNVKGYGLTLLVKGQTTAKPLARL